MARSKGNITTSSIAKPRTGGTGGRTATGLQGKGGNASIKGSKTPSKRQDMKAKTTGSDIKAPRVSPYDPGMHK